MAVLLIAALGVASPVVHWIGVCPAPQVNILVPLPVPPGPPSPQTAPGQDI